MVILMDKRKTKLIVNKSGGTSSNGGKTYRVTIPNTWIEQLGLSEDNRSLNISFDGDKIIIKPEISLSEYSKKYSNNHLVKLNFYNNQTLCTAILADYTEKNIIIKNFTDNKLYRAFGANDNPDWRDYLSFLEDRVIPRTRAGLREYLNTLGIDEYNPLEIIKKTHGKMAEDNQWIEVCGYDS